MSCFDDFGASFSKSSRDIKLTVCNSSHSVNTRETNNSSFQCQYLERRWRVGGVGPFVVVVPQIFFVISEPIFDVVYQVLRNFRTRRVVTCSVVSFVFSGSTALGNNQDLQTQRNHVR